MLIWNTQIFIQANYIPIIFPRFLVDCTVILSREFANTSETLYNDVILKYRVISLQSYLFLNNTDISNSYVYILQTQALARLTVQKYKQTLAVQRHSPVCTVYLSGDAQIVTGKSTNLQYYAYSKMWNLIGQYKTGKILIADYNLIALRFLDSVKPEDCLLTVIRLIRVTKVIVINLKSQKLYIGCYSCEKQNITEAHLYQGLITTLVYVPEIYDKMDFDNIWKRYNWLVRDFGVKNKRFMRGSNGTCDEGLVFKHYLKADILPEQTCAIQTILVKINCSMLYCGRQIFMTLRKINIISDEDRTWHKSYSRTFSLGAQFDGINYFVVLGKQEQKMGILIDMTIIMKPISSIVWLGILVAGCFTALLVWGTRTMNCQTAIFWTFTVLLEKGDAVQRSSFQFLNAVLMLWVFSCILFRSIYMLNMYSYLTKSPPPENIPKTFYQLYTGDITVFTDSSIDYKISNNIKALKLYNPDRAIVYEHLLRDTYTFSYYGKQDEIVRNISQYKEIGCTNATAVSFMQYFNAIGTKYRFSILYEEYGYNNVISSRFLAKLLLHGGRTVVSIPNNQHILITPVVWYLKENSYYSENIQGIIGSITEGGIFDKYQKSREVFMFYKAIHTNFTSSHANYSRFTFATQAVNEKSMVSNLEAGVVIISLNSFFVVLLTYVCLIAICLIAYIVEIGSRFIKFSGPTLSVQKTEKYEN